MHGCSYVLLMQSGRSISSFDHISASPVNHLIIPIGTGFQFPSRRRLRMHLHCNHVVDPAQGKVECQRLALNRTYPVLDDVVRYHCIVLR